MAKQALETIKQAEEQSGQLIEKANADAVKLVEDASHKAERDMAEMAEQFRGKAASMKEDAEVRAKEKQEGFSAETQTMVQELKEKLLAKETKAVDLVIQTIVE